MLRNKLCLLLIGLFLAMTNTFAQNVSAVSLFEKLSVIETVYFDIIYPPASEETAKYLAMSADNLYLKAADFLGVKNIVRMPVVLTQKTDKLNAYFTIIPYSRIVLYDTLPDEELAVFDDSVLSVFYHELMHAISLKNNLQHICVLDDATPIFTALEMPPSMTEGLAVLAESADGFGRLNSSYSTHVIRQAKIENKFPDWRDIAGSYSLYTDGSLPYIFGGSFMDYVYTTYGAQKLADFWNESAKINLTTYTMSFKKVYGKSIEAVWSEYEKSIIPPTLQKKTHSYFLEEKNNTMIKTLASSEMGIAWQDLYSNYVYFLPHENESQKEEKLFSTDLKSHLSFSQDGAYLVVSGETGYPNAENYAKVFDMEHKSFINTQKDLRDATVINLSTEAPLLSNPALVGVKDVLVGLKTEGQNTSMVFFDLHARNDSEPLITIPFNYGTLLFTPVDGGNGKIIALMKNYGSWEFFVYDYISGVKKTFKVSADVKPSDISSLYATEANLYMSFALSSENQPVLASIPLDNFSNETLSLSYETVERSGGVFLPVVIPPEDNAKHSKIVYASRFYEHRNLSVMESTDTTFNSLEYTLYSQDIVINETPDYAIGGYNPFKYMYDGLFIPFIGSVNLTPIDERSINAFSIGASTYFVDPVERLLIGGGAGYDIFKNRFTATLSSVFSEQNFVLSSEGYIETSTDEIEVGATKIFANISFPIVTDYSQIGFSNSFRWFYHREENDYYYDGISLDNAFFVYFSHIKKTGPEYFEKIGFVVGNQLQIEKYYGPDIRLSNDLFFGDLVMLEVYLPWIIPVKNPSHFTVNLPLTASFKKMFRFSADWEVESSVVLFSYDIQKALPFVHLFFQRVVVDIGSLYTEYKDQAYALQVMGNIYTTLALNAGIGTGYPVDLGLAVVWNPLLNGIEGLNFGLKFEMNL